MTIGELARYYRQDSPSILLGNILNSIYLGQSLTSAYMNFLQAKGLTDLRRLAAGELTYQGYLDALEAAEAARRARIEAERAAEAARRASEVEAYQRRKEADEAARIARESDPAYIAMMQRKTLAKAYGIYFVEPALEDRINTLLLGLDTGKALSDEDYLWLTTKGRRYFTDQVRQAHHRSEANRWVELFKGSNDPWHAINGSSSFRKCDKPGDALELLDRVRSERLNLPKVESAFCTNRGGVMRDLGRRHEAMTMGERGHKLMPEDYRPCTLLGAVNVELGNYDIARKWYDKAVKLGAPEGTIDSDLRRIFLKADKAKRESIRTFLLAEDAFRYAWVNDKKYR